MDSMMWLRLIFAIVLLGGAWVGFAILFCGLVDEETRQQVQQVRAQVRATRKKASLARAKALKKAWHDKRGHLFAELSKSRKGSLNYGLIEADIMDHLAVKP